MWVSVLGSCSMYTGTGTSRRLTEGTSGLSGNFFTKEKGVFSKTALLES